MADRRRCQVSHRVDATCLVKSPGARITDITASSARVQRNKISGCLVRLSVVSSSDSNDVSATCSTWPS